MKTFLRRFSIILPALALAVTLAACGGGKNKPNMQAREMAVPVTVAPATQRDVPVQVKAIGNVEAYSTVQVKSMVGGEIVRAGFTEGQDVRKGQLLFAIDPRPYQAALAQAEGNLARDEAQAANAQAQATRYAALFKDGVVSKEQYDQMVTQAKAATEVVRADHAAVETARVNLAYCTIVSPIDGRTGNVAVKVGNIVKANDVPLVTINQIRPIYVSFSVPQQFLPDIKKYERERKLPVQAKVPNEPADTGVLTFIDNAVDPQTGMIKLKGTFSNGDHRLWPGQFADVVMTLATDKGAVVVPSAAVQTGQNGQFVFVVTKENKAEMRPVTIGRVVESETVIRSGVQPGEQVVTDGQLRLTPGVKVALSNAPGSASQSASDAPARQGNGL
jgi:multidrug efflux system membrane fusion protein